MEKVTGSDARPKIARCESPLNEVYDEPTRRPAQMKQRQPDITKAKEVLGWQPSIELEQGLVKTVDYFRRFV